MDEELRFYRRRLPHFPKTAARYFITWRVARTQKDLEPRERDLVVNAVRHFDAQRYRLDAFVVMNDHVHVIVEPVSGYALESIVASWKSFSSHQIQKMRGHRGRFWQQEYFDRVIRDADELEEQRKYISNNPFKRWPELESYEWVWPFPESRY